MGAPSHKSMRLPPTLGLGARALLQWLGPLRRGPRPWLDEVGCPVVRACVAQHKIPRGLAASLQRDPSAFEPRLFDASSVRRKPQPAAPASATGRGAARYGGLRAPARCNVVLEGTIEETGDASHLTLTVVRRIRAGQLSVAGFPVAMYSCSRMGSVFSQNCRQKGHWKSLNS